MTNGKSKGFDIFAHELVPRHKKLKKDEAEDICRRYRIKPHQLPHIKAGDPAAKAVKAEPGDIIEITRRSPTAGEIRVYRYVVEG